MTEAEDFKEFKREIDGKLGGIQADVRDLVKAVQALSTASALGEERQGETTKKLDLLTIAMSNNYVSAAEFGSFKNNTEGRVDKLENWLIWILRLTIGAVILAAIAAARLKGGI